MEKVKYFKCPHCGLVRRLSTEYHFAPAEQAKCKAVEAERKKLSERP